VRQGKTRVLTDAASSTALVSDARTAGILAGLWFVSPGRRLGHELVAAGLVILAGVTDRDQLEQAGRVGYERGRGSLQGYDPTC
jgi:hypothetical protein